MSRGDIEFVYFDLGNVLVSFDPSVACENVAERFCVEQSRAQAVIYDSGLQDRFEHGEVSGEEFAVTVRAELGLNSERMPTAELLDAVSDMFTPIDLMGQLIREVRASDHRIGILSNTCHAHWDWIARQNWSVMEGPLEIEILSYQVGAMKPDARIYEAAERACGVQPRRILFLDDKPENVQAAIHRGWQAVECLGGPQAADELRRFGVIA